MNTSTLFTYTSSMRVFYSILAVMVLVAAGLVWSFIRRKKSDKKFLSIDNILLIAAIIAFAIPAFRFYNEYSFFNDAYKNGDCLTVSGEVEGLESGDVERFNVGGVTFEYEDSIKYPYYHKHYGIVSGNGQYLEITYVQKDGRNCILDIKGLLPKN